ncbi:MAG: DUF3301 domain-containing protein [Burkholderiales bacterium]|nr:DUF3301 domain-containing protein [Burkholderiales bacterium]
MTEIFAVMLLVGLAWFWSDSLRARESAIRAARLACTADGVQLLDDTVALAALGMQRSDDGRPVLRRIYRFEFSDTGNNRLDGSVTLLGAGVQALYLAPHAGTLPQRLPGPLDG